MRPSKMRRRLMGLFIFSVMGISLYLTGTNALAVKAAEAEVAIDETNFPDSTFREYVKEFDTDENGILSSAELQDVTRIDVSGPSPDEPGDITSLEGIEYFTALERLNCNNNQLTGLNVDKNTKLIRLNCSFNQLTELEVGENTELNYLYCNNNQLTSLEVVEKTKLISLECYNNQLTSLDVKGNTALTTLFCYNNRLASLDVRSNIALTSLYCQNNQLESLDVSKNTSLENLSSYDNQLTSLDVSENIDLLELYCEGNQLTSLDVSNNTKLDYLHCDNNTYNITFLADKTFDMSTLPGMDVSKVSDIIGGTIEGNILTVDSDVYEVTYTYDCGNSKTATFKLVREVAIDETNFPDSTFREYVKQFDTDENGIFSSAERQTVTEIGVSGPLPDHPGDITSLKGIEYFTALETLYCDNNHLSSLDVGENTKLIYLDCSNNQLTSLDVGSNTVLARLNCGYNQLTSLDVRSNTVLIRLTCSDNQLTSLELGNNTSLTYLSCGYNQLTSLDVSNNTALIDLLCGYNQLTSLEVSSNTALINLYCEYNQLTSLDVSNNTALSTLACYLNIHAITLSEDNTFDMSTLPGMDVSKISKIYGGTIKGNILTVDSDAKEVRYKYDCGNGETADFRLVVEEPVSPEDVAINETNFPDDTFRDEVKKFDTNRNGSFSSAELQAVTGIYVSGDYGEPGDITSLKGIEYFTALEYLECGINQLTSLDISKNTALKVLDCRDNKLTSLDVSKNKAMTNLDCCGNQLTSLDVSQNTSLTELCCNNNQLTSLNVSKNINLEHLYCVGNKLTSLDVSMNKALTELFCFGNQLTSLGVSKNTALYWLQCNNNRLTSLDVSKNEKLTQLNCSDNLLTSLDVSRNTALRELLCDNNRLTSLDVSKNTALTEFWCLDNINTIAISTGNTFDMSTLPGMNVSKVSNIKGGTIKGNILTVDSGAKEVTYTYDCGNGKTADFKLVVKKSVSSAKITLPKSSYIYTGSAIKPSVTVTYGGKKLVAGTDYTVTYSNNKAVGTATVTFTGKGNYAGTVKKTFKIVPASTTLKSLANASKGINIKWKKVSEAGGYVIYRSKNGGKFSKIKTITSGKTVSYTDKAAKTNGAKYQYKIISYKKVGKTAYQSGYSKTKTIYCMSAPKINGLTNKSGKKIAVKWTKNKKATGYQIQYATDSKFKKAKTVTVKKASSVSKVITKLKKNSTYRVRVRAYKKVSGKNYYSTWSSTKSVKVRK